MLIFEEEGIKQSFKIILNTKGVVIKIKKLLSPSYKEVFSKLYHEVDSVRLTNRIIQTEFVIDGISLNFDNSEEAGIISNLIILGKTNTERLINYIGQDIHEVNINKIDLEDVEDNVSANRFNRTYPHALSDPIAAGNSQVGMSPSATLDHIISMRLKSMGESVQQVSVQETPIQQTPVQPVPEQEPTIQAPAAPPPIGVIKFSFYAYIEGKQQGPYDEKQFANLVQYGLVDANTPVWKEGMSQWKDASSVPETMKFFQQKNSMIPPPPPMD